MAYELKNKGNERYKQGDYQGAEELYSQAIRKNTQEPAFFNNRALVRTKLESWAGAEQDARMAISLYGAKDPAALKSKFYLAQALLGLGRPAEAYEVALAAYKASVEIKNPNAEPLSRTLLKAKQAIWAAKETARLRERDETLKQMEELIEADLKRELKQLQRRFEAGEIGGVGYAEDQRILREEAQKKVNNVREVFAAAKGGDMKERVVPDYLIDSISFEIMHDPVSTPSGQSFDRVSILKHLQQNPIDPFSRLPMTAKDLRPNYALKAACEEFLEKNGWAVDW
ncbi:U-box-domain-containing protein [Emydomyces testavorans]|uniref:U-box-domain-containing protein n=1 Tax=Emydomyces testavorans TaxID=2070801 RepID=A0AAF0DK39_9EURO|nr:U-box-domain-containing protein [Emydomyces testavorans]